MLTLALVSADVAWSLICLLVGGSAVGALVIVLVAKSLRR